MTKPGENIHVSLNHLRVAVSSPECCRGELIVDAGVAGGIIVIAVALGSHPQIVEVHGVEANDPGQELVVGDVLRGGAHDLPPLLVQSLITPVRVDLVINGIER